MDLTQRGRERERAGVDEEEEEERRVVMKTIIDFIIIESKV